MSLIEEVGARVVLMGTRNAAREMDSFKKSIVSTGTTVKKTNAGMVAANQSVIDSNAKVAVSRAEVAAAQRDLAAKMTAAGGEMDVAAKTTADAQVASAKRQVAALRTVALAASSEKTSAVANARVVSMSAAADASVVSAGRTSKAMSGLAKVGKVAFLGTAAAVGYLGFEGVKRMSAFSDQVERLHTLANVPQASLPALSSWMTKSSPKLLENVGTLADQMYRIASAGKSSGMAYTVTQLEAMTKAAAHLSVLGGPLSDPQQVARVFGIINAVGGLGSKSGEQIGLTAAATVGRGDMTMQDYINAMGKGHLAPVLGQYGISQLDVGAMMANLGDQGITGGQAGQTLAHALTLMGTPVSKKAVGMYQAIGLAPNQVGMEFRNKNGMAGIQLLNQHMAAPLNKYLSGDKLSAAGSKIGALNGLNPAQIKQLETVGAGGMGKLGQQIISSLVYSMFGGAKQGAGVLTLLTGAPREAVKKKEISGDISHGAAKIDAQYKTAASTFKRWDLDLQQFENLLGTKVLPKILDLGNWVGKHKGVMVALGVALGGVVALGFLAWAGSVATATLAFFGLDVAMAPALGIMALVVLAVGAIAFGIYELWTHWDTIWKWMGDHKRYAAIILIAGLVIAPFLFIPFILAGIATHWSEFWTDLKKYAGDGVNDIIKIINGFTGLINKALGWAGVHIPQIGLVTWGASNPGIKGEGKGVSGNNAKRMATGGMITNTPTAIVGEGNPRHPEWVIPTDPAYRTRALSLYESLGTQLMSKGGSFWGKAGSIAKSVVDPGGIAGKAAHGLAGLALGPIKAGALAAANAIPAGLFRQTADGIINKLFAWASGKGKSATASSGGGGGGGSAAPAGQVKSWIDQALGLMGQPLSFEGGLYKLIMSESGGNPNAVNNWDSNAKAGHPSQGLMQTIPGTFGAYVWPGLRGASITDPIANITAGFRYALANYGAGMIEAGGRHTASGGYLGYAKGGVLPVASYDVGGLLPVGASIAVNGTGRPEPVGHNIGTTIELHVHGSVYGDRKALMREIQQAVGDAVARR